MQKAASLLMLSLAGHLNVVHCLQLDLSRKEHFHFTGGTSCGVECSSCQPRHLGSAAGPEAALQASTGHSVLSSHCAPTH